MSDAAAATAEPVSFFRRISLPGFRRGSTEKPKSTTPLGGGGRKWWTLLYRPRMVGFVMLAAWKPVGIHRSLSVLGAKWVGGMTPMTVVA